MLVSKLTLKNWRNFTRVEVALQPRQFIVGPNACGKSNLLDVFRFLRDIAKRRGGGLQEAIEKRGGLSKVRCLSARRDPEIVVGVAISDSDSDSGEDQAPRWRYEIGIRQETRGFRQPYLSREKVWSRDEQILDRPDDDDRSDPERLKQTYLEQVNNNLSFRAIGDYFDRISYTHLVPQLLRHSDALQGRLLEDDPFGQGFLESVAKANPRTRRSRLAAMGRIITAAVPKLKDIEFERDEATGRPHLSARYSHWRSKGARQREEQFSDGTLRLMALVWYLLESDSLLLFEEPELSLHAGITERLAALLHRSQRRRKRQMLLSTHSSELLSDPGIGGEEVLLLSPTNEGTTVDVSSSLDDIRSLLNAGVPVGEAVIPRTKPENAGQLALFE